MSEMPFDPEFIQSQILPDDLETVGGLSRSGRVTAVKGMIVRADLPDARLNEICVIRREGVPDLKAEVIGFDQAGAMLMPYDRLESVAADALVTPEESGPEVPCGDAVRGRVIDALGAPTDGLGPLRGNERAPLYSPPPSVMSRQPIDTVLETGLRAVDGLLTIGVGQRVAICAPAGVGKSTLLSTLVRNIDADRVVLALIGERRREVAGFVRHDLGEEGMKKATVVVSTSDESALMRMRAAYTATAIAEKARDKGERVILMMDSVTRFARALRDLGQAVGEPTGRGGYPASMYARLPQLFERAGNGEVGSITAFYTVLADSDSMDDPVVEETISLIDGHILLSRAIASSGRYPAIDILGSKSRLMNQVVDSDDHKRAARNLIKLKSEYLANLAMINMDKYEGFDMDSATIKERNQEVEAFLGQGLDDRQSYEEIVDQMNGSFGDWWD